MSCWGGEPPRHSSLGRPEATGAVNGCSCCLDARCSVDFDGAPPSLFQCVGRVGSGDSRVKKPPVSSPGGEPAQGVFVFADLFPPAVHTAGAPNLLRNDSGAERSSYPKAELGARRRGGGQDGFRADTARMRVGASRTRFRRGSRMGVRGSKSRSVGGTLVSYIESIY